MESLTVNNFTETIKNGYSLVDMYADWCGPCRAMAPVLGDFASNNPYDVKVFKVDVDVEQGLASQFNITSIPCMIVFKDGVEIGRIIGAMPLPVLSEEVRKIITT